MALPPIRASVPPATSQPVRAAPSAAVRDARAQFFQALTQAQQVQAAAPTTAAAASPTIAPTAATPSVPSATPTDGRYARPGSRLNILV